MQGRFSGSREGQIYVRPVLDEELAEPPAVHPSAIQSITFAPLSVADKPRTDAGYRTPRG